MINFGVVALKQIKMIVMEVKRCEIVLVERLEKYNFLSLKRLKNNKIGISSMVRIIICLRQKLPV